MIFRKLIRLGFLAIILFAFFGAFGSMRQSRSEQAYMAGYIAGQQAALSADGTDASAPPVSPYDYNGRYHRHGGFFPSAGLFLCLLPLIFFGFMSMLFGGRHHRRQGCHGRHQGPGSEQTPRHHHGNWQGNAKPVWDDDEFENDPPKKA